MGLHFDWDVDDNNNLLAAEDVPDRRIWHCRIHRLLRLGLIGLSVVALTAWLLAKQRQQLDARLRQEVEAAVYTELTALRVGDRAAFLRLQSDQDTWQAQQTMTFGAYQSGHSVVNALTGEVLNTATDLDRAQVSLAGAFEEVPFCVTWTYERTTGGWLHIPAETVACGNPAIEDHGAFTLSYYPYDRSYARRQVFFLNAWFDQICGAFDCRTYPPYLTIHITPDNMTEPYWQTDEILIIPSPALSSSSPGPENDVWAARLAEYLSRYVRLVYQLPSMSTEEDALLQEFAVQAYRGSAMDSRLGFLATAYGRNIIPDLLAELAAGSSLPLALDELSRAGALGAGTDDLRPLFTTVLQLEAIAIQTGDQVPPAEYAFLASVDPASIRVEEIFSMSEKAPVNWAVVHWQHLPDAPVPATAHLSSDDLVCFVPFQEISGYWTVSYTTPVADRSLRERTQGQFTVTYQEGDDYLVEPILVELNTWYPKIAADFGLESLPPAHLTLAEQDRGWEPFPAAEIIDLTVVTSPYWNCEPNDLATLTARDDALQELFWELADLKTGTRDNYNQLKSAIVYWLQRSYGLADDADRLAANSHRSAPPLRGMSSPSDPSSSLVQLWYRARVGPSVFGERDRAAAIVLVDVLVETYGRQAIAPLLETLYDAGTPEQWLAMSVNTTVEAVEPGWQARLVVGLEGS